MSIDNDDSPLDRGLQRKLLLAMRRVYPRRIRAVPEGVESDSWVFDANLLYLEEHGLCSAGMSVNKRGGYTWRGARITARGLDFLEDDGGLSAILGTVIVRLHAETLRALIEARIEAAPIPPAEKSALRRHLAALPEMALRAATTDLAKLGLEHLPDVATWLRTLAGL